MRSKTPGTALPTLLALLFALPVAAATPSKVQNPLQKAEAEVMNRYKQGDYQAALSLAMQALADAETQYGNRNAKLIPLLIDIGSLNRLMMNLDAAELYYRRAEALTKATGRPNASLLNNLGELLTQQDKVGESRAMLKQAEALLEGKTAKGDHSLLLTVLNNLANTYTDQERVSIAEPLYLRVLAESKKTYGPDALETASTLSQLGRFYQCNADHNKALPLLKRALAIKKTKLGEDHPDTAIAKTELAASLIAQEQLGEGLPLLQQGISVLERRLGPNHSDLLAPLTSLAKAEIAQEDYVAAQRHGERALAIAEKTWGKDAPQGRETAFFLLASVLLQQDHQQTLAYAERLLPAIRKDKSIEAQPLVTALTSAATAAEQLKQWDKARDYVTEAMSIIDRHPNIEFTDAATLFHLLGDLRQEEGNNTLALGAHRHSLDMITKRDGVLSANRIPALRATINDLYLLGRGTEVTNYFAQLRQIHLQAGETGQVSIMLDQVDQALVLTTSARQRDADALLLVATQSLPRLPPPGDEEQIARAKELIELCYTFKLDSEARALERYIGSAKLPQS